MATTTNVISIAAGRMQFLLDDGIAEQGLYGKLLNSIYVELSPEWVVRQNLYPPARASMLFDKKVIDCIVPADIRKMKNQDLLLISTPFSFARAYIYTRAESPVVESTEDLKGLIVGKRLGFSYGNYKFPQGIKYVPVSSLKQSIIMLDKERIDAFIAYEPDLYFVAKEFPQYSMHRANDFIIHQQPEAMVCHRSKRLEKFINEFNEKMTELGVIEKLNRQLMMIKKNSAN